MRNILFIISFLLVSAAAQAQTSIGIFDHFANSAASESPDGVINRDAVLTGKYQLDGLVATSVQAEQIKAVCSIALNESGFDCFKSEVIFGDIAAFGIVDGTKTIPGTWKETAGKSVRISFNKIFTYGMTGRIVPVKKGYELYFPAKDFTGFVQRSLALIGKRDTGATISELERLCDDRTEIGFRIIRR